MSKTIVWISSGALLSIAVAITSFVGCATNNPDGFGGDGGPGASNPACPVCTTDQDCNGGVCAQFGSDIFCAPSCDNGGSCSSEIAPRRRPQTPVIRINVAPTWAPPNPLRARRALRRARGVRRTDVMADGGVIPRRTNVTRLRADVRRAAEEADHRARARSTRERGRSPATSA